MVLFTPRQGGELSSVLSAEGEEGEGEIDNVEYLDFQRADFANFAYYVRFQWFEKNNDGILAKNKNFGPKLAKISQKIYQKYKTEKSDFLDFQ